jgi:hypothetical protein
MKTIKEFYTLTVIPIVYKRPSAARAVASPIAAGPGSSNILEVLIPFSVRDYNDPDFGSFRIGRYNLDRPGTYELRSTTDGFNFNPLDLPRYSITITNPSMWNVGVPLDNVGSPLFVFLLVYKA